MGCKRNGGSGGTSDDLVRAAELRSKATQDFVDRKGQACLDHLAAADKLDPSPERIATSRLMRTIHAQCTMLAGHCDEGKVELRVAFAENMKDLGPTMLDNAVDSAVGTYCGDGATLPRDRLQVATSDLERAHLREDPDVCESAYRRIVAIVPKVEAGTQPRDKEAVEHANRSRTLAFMCLGKASRCPAAYKMFNEIMVEQGTPPRVETFSLLVPTCVGKF
jgi:hypothetical protein